MSGSFIIGETSLRARLRSLNVGYPFALELNEILHLNHLGVQTIENLQLVPELQCLYLEGNSIETIENLDACPNLRCLYLARNYVEEIENLDMLKQLRTLDLSENRITTVENLEACDSLDTLNLRGNKLASADSIRHLTACKALKSVDVSKNRIAGSTDVVDVLLQLTNLTLLRAFENPFVKEVSGYRKTVLGNMQWLSYLDDAPAFDKDKRCAAAWLTGGVEAERAERDVIRAEEEATRQKNRENFQSIIAEAEARAARGEVEPVDPYRFRPHERGVHPLDTYDDDDDDDVTREIVANHYRSKGMAAPPRQRKGARATVQQAMAGGDEIPELPAVEVAPAADDQTDQNAWTLLSRKEGASVSKDADDDDSLREEDVHLEPPSTAPEPEPEPEPEISAEELERRQAAKATIVAREAAFRQQLQDEALRRAAVRTTRRAEAARVRQEQEAAEPKDGEESAPRMPRLGEFRIPQVWGTDRYASLWEKAKQVGEWQEDNQPESSDAEQPDGAGHSAPDMPSDGIVDDDGDDSDVDPMERYSVTRVAGAANNETRAASPPMSTTELAADREEDLYGLD